MGTVTRARDDVTRDEEQADADPWVARIGLKAARACRAMRVSARFCAIGFFSYASMAVLVLVRVFPDLQTQQSVGIVIVVGATVIFGAAWPCFERFNRRMLRLSARAVFEASGGRVRAIPGNVLRSTQSFDVWAEKKQISAIPNI